MPSVTRSTLSSENSAQTIVVSESVSSSPRKRKASTTASAKISQPPEAPLPRGATKLDLIGRDPELPELYILKSHSLVPQRQNPQGRIILMVCDLRPGAMEKLFRLSSNKRTPVGEAEALSTGELIFVNMAFDRSCSPEDDSGVCLLRPSMDDRVLIRHKYGSGQEKDDEVVTWALAKEEMPERLQELRELRSSLLGKPEEMTAHKPTQKGGKLVGGIAFERSTRAHCLSNGPRCYRLSLSIQLRKRMSAPAANNKVFEVVKDDDAAMRFNLLKSGSTSATKGMWKGGSELERILATQALFTNLPRVGTDTNVAHPSFQLNVASAVEPSRFKSGAAIASLGKFGSAHVDGGDSPACPTAMTILSPQNDEVEEEIFFLIDFGLGWYMEEFSTLFFSGLHIHGGCQPTYKRRKRNRKNPYYRLTLIAYPPNDPLAGADALAFAALPNKLVLPIGYDLRNPSTSHLLNARVHCEQATYTGDGSSVFEPISQLRDFTGGICELVVGLIRQLDPCLLARVDIHRLISAFSCVVDGVRVQAPDSPLAPGWSGDDVRIGKRYHDFLQSNFDVSSLQKLAEKEPEALALMWNTDVIGSTLPFNNSLYQQAMDEWEAHIKRQQIKIPLYATIKSQNPLGGRLASRAKGLAKSARNADSKAKGSQQPTKKKSKGGVAKNTVVDGADERPAKRRRVADNIPAESGNVSKDPQPTSDVESEDSLEGPTLASGESQVQGSE
ncbi:hypothetical protein CPB83DRAFT_900449 [Crepidotus variabilis]|uniref:Uncharacterized protein n=1 Tax=Crepidotus variabilis TaxID=179855 RepID=A0A9P6JHQ8_9AGAR|nr:hypothetical protein CPB83DRAFT_900449 [Crepidotus variabilis]